MGDHVERLERSIADREGRGLDGDAKADYESAKAFRERVVSDLAESLDGDPLWRGWDFWRVVTLGGFDPTMVLKSWTLEDVWLTSYQLRVRALFNALE